MDSELELMTLEEELIELKHELVQADQKAANLRNEYMAKSEYLSEVKAAYRMVAEFEHSRRTAMQYDRPAGPDSPFGESGIGQSGTDPAYW